MDNILNLEGDNTGSLDTIHFIPVGDVVSIHDAEDFIIMDPVELALDKSWYTMQVSMETPGFTESEFNQGGKGLKLSVDGFIPGHNANYTSLLMKMRYVKYILIIKDQDGNMRLIGSLLNPVRFKYSFDTSNRTPGRKGYNISFYQTAKNPPFFYNSPFVSYPEEISPSADFITLDAYLNAYLAAVLLRIDALEESELEFYKIDGSRKPTGDMDFSDIPENGIIQKDRVTGVKYRVFISDGAFDFEIVT